MSLLDQLRRAHRGALALLLFWGGPAAAAIITVGLPVGPPPACACSTVQCGIDAAAANAGPDTVRLTRSINAQGTYYDTDANIDVNAADELTIEGGYATCDQGAADMASTVLSGATDNGDTGDKEPVLEIRIGTAGVVKLRRLVITKGDEEKGYFLGGDDGFGGGIDFRGNGTLDIADTTITNNIAHTGAGIYAEGSGSAAELIIGANVQISNNTAELAGGGIAMYGLDLTMNGSNSTIAFNEATGNPFGDGYGGGLFITGLGGRRGTATIGTAGLNGVGAIFSNTAERGGGAAVVANDLDEDNGAWLHLVSADPASPTSITGNFASQLGGGVYLRTDTTNFPTHINNADMQAANHARLEDNASPTGAAVYLDYTEDDIFNENYGATMTMTDGAIVGNVASDINAVRTDGAIIHIGDETTWGSFRLERVTIAGNDGGPVLRNDNDAILSNVLIAGNISKSSVIQSIGGDGMTDIRDTTIAGNTIAGNYVLSLSDDTILKNSIVYQPNKTSVQHSGGSLDAQYVVTSERASIDGGASPYVLQADPRFVDPGHGDYRLRAASPGVDYAPIVMDESEDLLKFARNKDLPLKTDIYGPHDAGAYERQGILPLVVNGSFDVDDRLWQPLTGQGDVWDGTQNIAGPAGSGSWHVNLTDGGAPKELVVARQCVYLPGPGHYLLDGHGMNAKFGPRGGPYVNDDLVRLTWEYRHDGGTTCTGGSPDDFDRVDIASEPSWSHASVPATIDVAAQDWTGNSSITVYLTVVDNDSDTPRTFVAWFDGITLDVEGLVDDRIFGDDFD
jgi:hypothetical protein